MAVLVEASQCSSANMYSQTRVEKDCAQPDCPVKPVIDTLFYVEQDAAIQRNAVLTI
jgi:hypothetical protein